MRTLLRLHFSHNTGEEVAELLEEIALRRRTQPTSMESGGAHTVYLCSDIFLHGVVLHGRVDRSSPQQHIAEGGSTSDTEQEGR